MKNNCPKNKAICKLEQDVFFFFLKERTRCIYCSFLKYIPYIIIIIIIIWSWIMKKPILHLHPQKFNFIIVKILFRTMSTWIIAPSLFLAFFSFCFLLGIKCMYNYNVIYIGALGWWLPICLSLLLTL